MGATAYHDSTARDQNKGLISGWGDKQYMPTAGWMAMEYFWSVCCCCCDAPPVHHNTAFASL